MSLLNLVFGLVTSSMFSSLLLRGFHFLSRAYEVIDQNKFVHFILQQCIRFLVYLLPPLNNPEVTPLGVDHDGDDAAAGNGAPTAAVATTTTARHRHGYNSRTTVTAAIFDAATVSESNALTPREIELMRKKKRTITQRYSTCLKWIGIVSLVVWSILVVGNVFTDIVTGYQDFKYELTRLRKLDVECQAKELSLDLFAGCNRDKLMAKERQNVFRETIRYAWNNLSLCGPFDCTGGLAYLLQNFLNATVFIFTTFITGLVLAWIVANALDSLRQQTDILPKQQEEVIAVKPKKKVAAIVPAAEPEPEPSAPPIDEEEEAEEEKMGTSLVVNDD